MALKETLQAYNAKVIAKLNYLYELLEQISPWSGLSPDPGQSLTTDAEGKLFYQERTAEEIATAYEGIEGVERFTTAHKETVEGLGTDLSNKADLDPATGKLRTDQVPAFSITNVVRAVENTFEAFLLNVNNYTYDVGDAIVITSVPDVEGNSTVSHYLYDGEDRSLSSSYSPISPNALATVNWADVQNVPAPVQNLSGTNTGDQDLSIIESDITDHETRIQTLEAAGPSSPVDATYANITALIADQNSQLEDFIYEVLDASDDGVTGRAYYFYNGTLTGTMDDYTSLTAQEVADLTAQAIIDALGYTPADDEDLVPFTTITENEHGAHPAFTDQHSFNVWVLQNIGGSTPDPDPDPETLNAPDPITATSGGGDSIIINWTDTNS